MFALAYPAYIREKALQLRAEQKLTIDEIAERLAISRTTAYEWVGHLPVPRRENPLPGTLAMQARYRRIREAAYEQGRNEYASLSRDPTFRDFVTLFIAEGTKRNRNTIAVANSDPAIIVVCVAWLRRLTERQLGYAVQVHEDQDLDAVRSFWSRFTGAAPDEIRLQRKTNSGRMKGRNWRSEHGVLTVRCHDTCLRARMQAWMDALRSEWLTLTGPGA
jgi:transposase-like protein